MFKRIALLATAGLLSTAALAQSQVQVSDPWIRATVPAQKATGAFMQLKAAKAARLLAASSPAAGRVEIHQMEMQGQTMRMHAVDGIDLPAGQAVNLASGGYHIMLLDLKRQLKEGEQVPMTLTVQGADGKRDSVNLTVPVKPLAYSAQGGH
ncbi:copper chaperone PCu(A)C [Massilia phyllosphaerae]|uniref:copper chaperone PCu(A)C n=1 Tax=Massilia phyllosphaerae TaxID=3106034 RepID=UPI002B1CBC77|nr:copper chaperone PCu(A)C [Massilia sp. SGZ-792]